MSDLSNKLQLLFSIEHSTTPIEVRLDMLRDVARSTLPDGTETRKRVETLDHGDPDIEEKFKASIRAMNLLLSHYLPEPAVDLLSQARDIETEVRISLNERFIKSPYFLFMSGMLAGCVTLFCFGLFSLNKDVKSADEQISKMQQQVTSATIAMNTAEANADASMRKTSSEFDEHTKTAESRITDAEHRVTATIETKFKEDLDEVHRSKKETIDSVVLEGQQAKSNIDSTQASIVGQLTKDTGNRVAALEDAKMTNLKHINDRGTELYYNLQKPSWKDLLLIGLRINWPLWGLALLAVVFSLIALMRR